MGDILSSGMGGSSTIADTMRAHGTDLVGPQEIKTRLTLDYFMRRMAS
jgi:hypothetical protein